MGSISLEKSLSTRGGNGGDSAPSGQGFRLRAGNGKKRCSQALPLEGARLVAVCTV